MTGRKKSEKQKLTQNEIDTHVKTFLQKGGKVIKISKGKSAIQNDNLIK
ncbi:MAG: hypothetical protein ACRBCI_10070 [Cellvibrionaceae bacterium]